MLHSQFYLVDAEITLWTYEDGEVNGNGNVNGNWYDLQGRKVNGQWNKKVYIIKGKKVIK
jgi:hypothetical protein